MNSIISNRYAKALFLLAKKDNILNEINDESQSLISFFSSDIDARLLLTNPVISKDNKLSIFKKSFKEKLSPLMLSFIKLVVNRGRYNYLNSILEQFNEMFKKEKNIISLELVSSRSLSDSLKQKIHQKLGSNENVIFKESIDPKVLGGILIKLNDLQYDATVKNKLNNVKKTFKI